MSVAFEVVETGLAEALLKIEGIERAPTDELMEGIARLVQEQTRRRIESEKTSPTGEGWKPNRAGTSTLFDSGALSASIDYVASAQSAQVGSGIVYARIHQQGGVIRAKEANALAFMVGNRLVQVQSVTIRARPYLGLSAANQVEVIEAAEDWLGSLLQ